MPEIIASWLVLGAAAGLLVYLFSPRRLHGGLLSDLVIGILTATAGGYAINELTGTDLLKGALTWGSVIVTLLAAALILLIIQTQGRRRKIS